MYHRALAQGAENAALAIATTDGGHTETTLEALEGRPGGLLGPSRPEAGADLCGLLTQPVDSTILRSMGSPTGVSWSRLRVWQVASARSRGPMGRRQGSGTSGRKACPCSGTTPITSKPSSVRVPVCRGEGGRPVMRPGMSWALLGRVPTPQARWVPSEPQEPEEVLLCL